MYSDLGTFFYIIRSFSASYITRRICARVSHGTAASRPAIASARARAGMLRDRLLPMRKAGRGRRALLNYEGQAGLDGGTGEVAGEAASLGEGRDGRLQGSGESEGGDPAG